MSYSQQHHESSYALITSHYYEEIYRHCYVQLSYNKADAEDCAQKVFLLLFERWHKIESTDNIRAWLYKTAGYVIKGHLRKNKKRTQPLDEEAESAESSGGEFEAIDALSILTDEERSFASTYYESGKTVGELSEQLHLSEAAIYKRINRIKHKLIKALKSS